MQLIQQRWARIAVHPPLYAVRPQARPVDETPISRRSARDDLNVEYTTVNVTGARKKPERGHYVYGKAATPSIPPRTLCCEHTTWADSKGSSACLADSSQDVY